MKILIWEHVTAALDLFSTPPSLIGEGRGMLDAVLAALAQDPSFQVTTCLGPDQPPLAWPDVRAETIRDPERGVERLVELAGAADRILIIAPESEGLLEALVERVRRGTRGEVVASSTAAIAVASDKLRTSEILGSHSVPTSLLDADAKVPDSYGSRLVVKPRDGAGSLFTATASRESLHRIVEDIRMQGYEGDLVVQPFRVGLPASVAGFVREGEAVLLPAVEQCLERVQGQGGNWSWLRYKGGRMPLSDEATRRIDQLFRSVVEKVAGLRGYVGIDAVLGADVEEDRVVDVNPRLTTSFVGYQRLLPKSGALGRLLLGLGQDPDRDEVAKLRETVASRSVTFVAGGGAGNFGGVGP